MTIPVNAMLQPIEMTPEPITTAIKTYMIKDIDYDILLEKITFFCHRKQEEWSITCQKALHNGSSSFLFDCTTGGTPFPSLPLWGIPNFPERTMILGVREQYR